MKQLHHLITELESKITHHHVTNLSISKSSVGWHIEHSLKTIDQIVSATKNSNPLAYKWKFNFKRVLILHLLQKIPRGKAKAPKVVQPEGEINQKTLVESVSKVKENILPWKELDKNINFQHPIFGLLNKKETENFLVLHTKHHLMIINDILKS